MTNTYVVEGGIGKCTSFTALLPKLKKKSDIIIYTPYINCFTNNPNVKMVVEQSVRIQDTPAMRSDNIFYCEPYFSNFQFGRQHLIESYCNLFNVEYDKNMLPKLYTENHYQVVSNWLKNKNIGKYILIQFSGGQSQFNYSPNTVYKNKNIGRNYNEFFAQKLINMLKKEYKNVTILDCTLPNEPSFEHTIKADVYWPLIHEMLKYSKGFIGIDSYLQHFSASTQTPGVVIWGSTRWTQFGYSHNKNLNYFMKDKWDESKYVENDPRNSMVEPEIVFEEFRKLPLKI
jgi:ADP-heptose:LPS heptosyltransferase